MMRADRLHLVWPKLILGLLALLAGCATPPPQNPGDLCSVFQENRDWYFDAAKARKRWGIPISVSMSFTARESSYVHDAKPPRTKLLWVVPWRRPSSAYGYAQATDATWKDYVKSTGRWTADRDDFGDALDFIGWYNYTSYKRLGIPRNDPYRLYLAYHEGHGGYSRGSYRKKTHVQQYARKVSDRAARYSQQLTRCEARLKKRRRWYWPFSRI